MTLILGLQISLVVLFAVYGRLKDLPNFMLTVRTPKFFRGKSTIKR